MLNVYNSFVVQSVKLSCRSISSSGKLLSPHFGRFPKDAKRPARKKVYKPPQAYAREQGSEVANMTVTYLENLALALGFEKEEILSRERQLRESLSVKELEIRGLAIRDIVIDPDYFNPCSKDGQLEIRLNKVGSSIAGGITWRPGSLISLQYSTDTNFENLDPWQAVDGIVSNINTYSITIRLSGMSPFILDSLAYKQLEGELRIIKRSEVHIYRSQLNNLKSLMKRKLTCDPRTPFGFSMNKIFNEEELPPPLEGNLVDIDHTPVIYDQRVTKDPAKVNAVRKCSECGPVTLIHGPPGTGKTTTLAAAVLSAVANNEKVLVTAPSHAACDAFTLALAAQWPTHQEQRFVRLGNPLRFTNSTVAKFSVRSVFPMPALDNLEQELAFKRRQLLDSVKGKGHLLEEEKELHRQHREATRHCEHQAILQSSVVITTILQANSLHYFLKKTTFDLVVIDEAGFSPASNVFKLVWEAPRLVLAGDHHQLPPVVLTQDAKKLGLARSLFELLAEKAGDAVCLLDVQFRSNSRIPAWSSRYFYAGQLRSSELVADSVVLDLIQPARIKPNLLTSSPLLFIDSAGLDWREEQEDEESVSNCDEAVFLSELVEKYISLGVKPHQIGVIAPYWAQIALIRSLVWEGSGLEEVEVRTVDGFQGREKEVVLISLVRSNTNREVGFLSETRRINVSVTRARRACIIVGDTNTLNTDTGLSSLIDHCTQQGSLCTVSKVYCIIDKLV